MPLEIPMQQQHSLTGTMTAQVRLLLLRQRMDLMQLPITPLPTMEPYRLHLLQTRRLQDLLQQMLVWLVEVSARLAEVTRRWIWMVQMIM